MRLAGDRRVDREVASSPARGPQAVVSNDPLPPPTSRKLTVLSPPTTASVKLTCSSVIATFVASFSATTRRRYRRSNRPRSPSARARSTRKVRAKSSPPVPLPSPSSGLPATSSKKRTPGGGSCRLSSAIAPFNAGRARLSGVNCRVDADALVVPLQRAAGRRIQCAVVAAEDQEIVACVLHQRRVHRLVEAHQELGDPDVDDFAFADRAAARRDRVEVRDLRRREVDGVGPPVVTAPQLPARSTAQTWKYQVPAASGGELAERSSKSLSIVPSQSSSTPLKKKL